MTLGEQLAQANTAMLNLILSTIDVEQKKQLNVQLASMLNLTGKLVDANVENNTQDYITATDALDRANTAIQDTINDLNKVADTILIISKVIDALGKIAAKMP